MKGFSDKKNNSFNKKKFSSSKKNNIEDLKIKAINYQKNGEVDKASKIYEILIDKKVNDFSVYFDYGILCQFQKNYNKSLLLYQESIKFNPKNQYAYFKIAFILNQKGKYKEAFKNILSSLNLDQRIWQSHLLLVQILENLSRTVEALDVAKKANEILPRNHLILAKIARLYSRVGEHKKSEEFYIKSIKVKSNDPEILYEYAIQLLSIGEKNRGSEILKKIVEINPNYSIAYFTLSRLLDTKNEAFYLDKILNFDSSIFKDNYNKYIILFAKSYIYHRIKDFNKSQHLLKKANDLKLIDKPTNSLKIIKLSEEIYNAEKNKKGYLNKKSAEAKHIFIVGLPRSGSTLVESILGINENVFNLGENSIFFNSYIDAMPNNFKNLSDIYSSKIQSIVNDKISTNKTLINYIYTPFIINYIEKSKIIFTFRNPLDNILSMYRAKFTGSGNEYSSCIVSSTKVLLNHLKIMNKYKNNFNNEIYFLNYDHLVNNPKKEIQRLTQWLNWEWDEKYLKPEFNKQAFSTASITEVRSAISNKSVGGWKNYQDLLRPAQDYLKSKIREIPSYFKDQFII